MNSLYTSYLLLGLAIVTEVTGSTFLTKSEGFTKLIPSVITVTMFVIAFYCLSQVLKTIPLGVAYAIWSGVGIILTAVTGFFVLKQPLDTPAVIGIAFIVMGVIIMNVFSRSMSH